jgi:hypothetical protein
VENRRKLGGERGPQLGKLKCRLGEPNNFRVENERVQLDPSEFQSPLGSSCSVVRATVGSGAEASRKYEIYGSRN